MYRSFQYDSDVVWLRFCFGKMINCFPECFRDRLFRTVT